MDIIVVSSKAGRSWRFRLSPAIGLMLGLALGALATSLTMFGYGLHEPGSRFSPVLLQRWAQEIRTQHAQLLSLRTQMQDNSQALSRRLAELQAHVMRLDAAGVRLTEIAELDPAEFNFTQPPPLGGPVSADAESGGTPLNVQQSLALLDQFEQQLQNRERQLRVLEDLLFAGRLQNDVKPSGWPTLGGWISSGFGTRNDPFTGRRAFHSGIDFAGRWGADVQAVAAGLIADVGYRPGYGLLVEVNHGNGYVTRYGHNSRVLVKLGDTIKKGQRIALMGDTGRATGPHVHFEVLLHGKVVNPERYIFAAR